MYTVFLLNKSNKLVALKHMLIAKLCFAIQNNVFLLEIKQS